MNDWLGALVVQGTLKNLSNTTVQKHQFFSAQFLYSPILTSIQWQPTPVFSPGESQGWGSLVGCHLWGHTESATTEVT